MNRFLARWSAPLWRRCSRCSGPPALRRTIRSPIRARSRQPRRGEYDGGLQGPSLDRGERRDDGGSRAVVACGRGQPRRLLAAIPSPSGAFVDGQALWLGSSMSASGTGAYTTLTPRSAVSPVPLAMGIHGIAITPEGEVLDRGSTGLWHLQLPTRAHRLLLSGDHADPIGAAHAGAVPGSGGVQQLGRGSAAAFGRGPFRSGARHQDDLAERGRDRDRVRRRQSRRRAAVHRRVSDDVRGGERSICRQGHSGMSEQLEQPDRSDLVRGVPQAAGSFGSCFGCTLVGRHGCCCSRCRATARSSPIAIRSRFARCRWHGDACAARRGRGGFDAIAALDL